MKKLTVIILFFISANIQAQTKSRFEFTSNNSIGTAWGNNQNVIVFQTINGFRYKKWNVGLGISLDGYGSQSTPLFLDFKRYIGKNNSFFVYTDLGVNVPWRTSNFPAKYTWNNEDAFKLKNTFYGEFGFGFKKLLVNKTFYVVSLGYSLKQFSYVEQNVSTWGIGGITGKTDYYYDFYYKRIALRFGIEF